MGKSSGGSTLSMQLTAYGDGQPASFSHLIVQSPAVEPAGKPPHVQDAFHAKFLRSLHVSSLGEAQAAPSQAIIGADEILVTGHPDGSSSIGPAVDGVFVPHFFTQLLKSTPMAANARVSALTTYSADEGMRLVPANLTTEGDFGAYMELLLAQANASVRARVQTALYPPVYNGSYPYTSFVQRARLFWSELVSVCNVNDIVGALPAGGWSTGYRVPPAMHLLDTSSIFWLGPGTDPTIDEKVVTAL